jgi:PTH2 family peptidyl-tRNA hydrolase
MHAPYAYKQVIVVRKDLNMRKGKLAAQVAHAVLNSFLDSVNGADRYVSISLEPPDIEWLKAGATKIVVGCSSEEELFKIYKAAQAAKLHTSLILDQGRTEFKEPTYTCCAVGPALSIEIDKITGGLSLL